MLVIMEESQSLVESYGDDASLVPPKNGWFKLNTDGAVSLTNQQAASEVEVESDNALLMESLLDGGSVNCRMAELRLIHGILNCEWNVRIRHVPRSQNAIVDHMARLAISGPPSLVVFEKPPTLVQ
ncbi:hypothetical protein Godav_017450 [Gossypium davidsonii]|uniref:RNase H type-1 domain-containing protein n=2 Tax=Gossypium TaxID=3633 RepID=A0A7J8QTJ6_GOSDV|nr:hypothetical protein [Gossypium davidsonii]MBA0639705.1 hypothetical protein [Gossypium klotzschianum]